MTFCTFKFVRSSSSVVDKSSGSYITPHVVFRILYTWTKTEKDPIVVQFEVSCDCLTVETSTSKSRNYNFLSIWPSQKPDWNVFALRNNEVLLKEPLSVSLRYAISMLYHYDKKGLNEFCCTIWCSSQMRGIEKSEILLSMLQEKQFRHTAVSPITEPNKGMHIHVTMLTRAHSHKTTLCWSPP